MERYCVAHIDRKDFQSPDAWGYLDINHNNLMKNLIIQIGQETGKVPIGPLSFKEAWKEMEYRPGDYYKSIPLSIGCEMDILNELYLILMAADDSEEFLSLTQDMKIVIKTGEKEISTQDQLDKLNESMKYTIHNKKKQDANLKDLIFDIKDLKESDNNKIHPLGSGVKRLWLYSKEFRGLFSKPKKKFGKYGMEELRKKLYDNGFGYIKYKTDDCIILEKLLGIDTRLHFHLYILLQLEGAEYKSLEPLVDTLMECEGIYSRRLYMLELSYQLSELQSRTIDYKTQWIKARVEKLKEDIKLFNRAYHKAIEIYMENYTKMYSYERVMEMVKDKRKILSSFREPFISQCPDYEEILREEVYKDIIKKIFHEKNDKTQAIKILERWDCTRNRMHLWSENELGYEGRPYEELDPRELSNQIQARIIEINHKKYNG